METGYPAIVPVGIEAHIRGKVLQVNMGIPMEDFYRTTSEDLLARYFEPAIFTLRNAVLDECTTPESA
jgi:hypothetical protein